MALNPRAQRQRLGRQKRDGKPRQEDSGVDGATWSTPETPSQAGWSLRRRGAIKGGFDNIRHHWRLDHLPPDKAPLRKWLKAGYIDQGQLFPPAAGPPHGGSLSPTVAKLPLDGGAGTLAAQVGQSNAKHAGKNHVTGVRSADDCILTGRAKALWENEGTPRGDPFLPGRGLTLSAEKTRVP